MTWRGRESKVQTAYHLQTESRDLAAHCARVLLCFLPAEHQRAQGMPGARCARSRACSVVNTRVSHHGHTGTTRHSPRNGFTAYIVLSPVTGLFATVIGGITSANLTPASGCQDHTTSPSASALFVKSAARVHRIPPYVRDDRETPLCVGRDGEGYRSDLGQRRSGIFLQTGLDWANQIDPVQQFAVCAQARTVQSSVPHAVLRSPGDAKHRPVTLLR